MNTYSKMVFQTKPVLSIKPKDTPKDYPVPTN